MIDDNGNPVPLARLNRSDLHRSNPKADATLERLGAAELEWRRAEADRPGVLAQVQEQIRAANVAAIAEGVADGVRVAMADGERLPVRAGAGPKPRRDRTTETSRDETLRERIETAARLAEDELAAGLRMIDTRWSILTMARYVLASWPLGPGEKQPAQSTIESYLGKAIARGRLPPVQQWPLNGNLD